MKIQLKSILLLALACHGAVAATFTTGQSAGSHLGTGTGSTASSLYQPSGVAMDPATGKLFVSDRLNHRVLRYTNAAAYQNGSAAEVAFGQSSTSLGGFPGGASTQTLLSPRGLAVDSNGNLWVADNSYNRVLRFPNAATVDNSGGAPTADLVLGQTAFNTSTSSSSSSGLSGPYAVAVSSTDVWVADGNNNRVTSYHLSGLAATGAAPWKILSATPGTSLNSPSGLALTSDTILWVADSGNNRVLRYDVTSSTFTAVLGQGDYTSTSTGSTASSFYSPEGLAADLSGATATLWVADRVNNRVLRFTDVNAATPAAAATLVLGQSSLTGSDYGSGSAQMYQPEAVATDVYDPMATKSSPRALWVADHYNNRVLRFSPHSPATSTPTPPAPRLSISGKKKLSTSKAKATIRGSVSGSVTSVTYKLGRKSGSASGTTGWKITAHLKPGKNVLTVTAHGPGGDSAPAKVVVIRK
jgi:sugar lactone lactonase YvrE